LAIDANKLTDRILAPGTMAVCFAIALITLLAFQYHNLHAHVELEAEQDIQRLLASYQAVQRVVREHHRPEIARLQQLGYLNDDYFSPILSSATHNAQIFSQYLNAELRDLAFPHLIFRIASDNPLNPVNLATPDEQHILNTLRRTEIDHVTKIERNSIGDKIMAVTVPLAKVSDGCLSCHGDPVDAPSRLRAMYPAGSGFGYQIGKVPATLSLRLPLNRYIQMAETQFRTQAVITLAVLTLLFAGLVFFIKQLQQQRSLIQSQADSLEYLSSHDRMTGAQNRAGFEQTAATLMTIARRYQEPLSLIMFDIDHFKQVNDQFGHQLGDRALKHLVDVAQTTIRDADILCRWGGEEFIVLCPKTELGEAAQLAERMRLALERNPLNAGSDTLVVKASFGVTTAHASESMDVMVARADGALYDAKNQGRNRVVVNSGMPV